MADQIHPLAIPLPVVEGGTGAATPLGANVNLEIPQGTIEVVQGGTGLTGYADSGIAVIAISPPVQIIHGGTGATTPANARAQLQVASAASPVLTGVPTAPTNLAPSNPQQIANWAMVQDALDNVVAGGIDAGTY